ncbi:MAG: hypothetical protein LC103_08845 [Anaerolineales bacterium]|nr:hypothetical protein [Anaerolineales bacterium]HOR84301.1 choice-of-anchor Q domain-containing protein [Anaerolineaceae bacterium]
MKNYTHNLSTAVLICFFTLSLAWGSASAARTPDEISGSIYYARPGETGNCSSWAEACDLQTALASAVSGDQIWAASGVYKPTVSANPAATFQLKSGVAIYGGFPAAGGGWESRNWEANPTRLSGDIGTQNINTDNSYHVVTSSGVNATAVLDGFTICDGNASGDWSIFYDRGGGLIQFEGSPTLRNLTFRDNAAAQGGGMYTIDGSPTLTNVSFINNSAGKGGGLAVTASNPVLTDVSFSGNTVNIRGGGMYTDSNSFSTLNRVVFEGNQSVGDNTYGGGMFNSGSRANLTDVTFHNNSSGWTGGAMANWSGSTIMLRSVTFSGNSTRLYGGGMDNSNSSQAVLTNVTFSGNTAQSGGGAMFNDYHCDITLVNVDMVGNSGAEGGAIYNSESTLKLTNSIIWGNLPNQINNWNATTAADHSIIQGGGYPGEGNLTVDPLLLPLGNYFGFTQTYGLSPASPAIDAGSPTTCPSADQRGVFRPIDGNQDGTARCDIGAFELPLALYLPIVIRQ